MKRVMIIIYLFGIFFLALSAFSECELDEYYWSPVDWGILGDSVWMAGTSMATYGGQLAVAVNYYNSHCSQVALWDGTDWTILGWSNSSIQPVIVYDGKLIVGGDFSNIGGIYSPNIAAWDGTSWSTVGPIVQGSVARLSIYNDGGTDKLIAGGPFGRIGSSNINCVAMWNGSYWSGLGSGVNTLAHAFTSFNDNLIVGGWFTSAGGMATNHIASWNGSSWSTLGSGVYGSDNAYVYTLATYNNQVFAGGSFDSAGTIAVRNLAMWDGSTWSPVGTGLGFSSAITYPAVYSLGPFDGKLIVGGRFDSAGGAPVSSIASWDGTSWKAIGTEAVSVGAIYDFNSELYAAGSFIFPGETEATQHIARAVRRTYEAGDASGDEIINLKDVTFIIKYLYQDGPAPVPLKAADADASSLINIKDATLLIKFLYKDGTPPICS